MPGPTDSKISNDSSTILGQIGDWLWGGVTAILNTVGPTQSGYDPEWLDDFDSDDFISRKPRPKKAQSAVPASTAPHSHTPPSEPTPARAPQSTSPRIQDIAAKPSIDQLLAEERARREAKEAREREQMADEAALLKLEAGVPERWGTDGRPTAFPSATERTKGAGSSSPRHQGHEAARRVIDWQRTYRARINLQKLVRTVQIHRLAESHYRTRLLTSVFAKLKEAPTQTNRQIQLASKSLLESRTRRLLRHWLRVTKPAPGTDTPPVPAMKAARLVPSDASSFPGADSDSPSSSHPAGVATLPATGDALADDMPPIAAAGPHLTAPRSRLPKPSDLTGLSSITEAGTEQERSDYSPSTSSTATTVLVDDGSPALPAGSPSHSESRGHKPASPSAQAVGTPTLTPRKPDEQPGSPAPSATPSPKPESVVIDEEVTQAIKQAMLSALQAIESKGYCLQNRGAKYQQLQGLKDSIINNTTLSAEELKTTTKDFVKLASQSRNCFSLFSNAYRFGWTNSMDAFRKSIEDNVKAVRFLSAKAATELSSKTVFHEYEQGIKKEAMANHELFYTPASP